MDGIIGQIQIFPFRFVPRGWAACNGEILPIAENSLLFSLIGNAYGGDGKTTFALPKLPPLTPVGPFYFICLEGRVPAPKA